ncbi:DNA-directed RNA polymerase III subunit RPC4 [Copidosoma floridanum]|uniref:DNA-directed RNA polymerase III subunit RPC4 n=1 Tax=Copidosoma floridanum TaxID=29053 RepID=UPI0006C9CB90|nr:DNA-directed RNA polymerase III subunit RPC4 [Copidosoma floridanum]
MASNSNVNHTVYPEYIPNLQIKSEPGIESESASTSTKTPDSPMQNLLTNIKVEPGNPIPNIPNNRLPSLFARRDLTLGGNVKFEKPKRVFTPNINAQRLKNREEQNSAVKKESTAKKEKGRGRDKAKNEKAKSKDGKGRGRGKAANNLVQSSGIFSEGLADLPSSRRPGSNSYSSYREKDSSGSERESLSRQRLSASKKYDRIETGEKTKKHLIDDTDVDGMDVDESNAPLTLPMVSKAKIAAFNNHKTEFESNDENTHSATLLNGQEKNEVQTKVLPKIAKDSKETVTITQVLEKNNKSSNFILLQLPDCLPGLRGGDEKPGGPKVKHNTEPVKENATEIPKSFCTLTDLKEGMLGKLQILKSGKARMILGENNLIVELGSTVSFRQDLIAAKIDEMVHDLVNLGRINSTLICAPDWEDLLKIL